MANGLLEDGDESLDSSYNRQLLSAADRQGQWAAQCQNTSIMNLEWRYGEVRHASCLVLWLGLQNTVGEYKDISKTNIFRILKKGARLSGDRGKLSHSFLQ